MQWYIKVLKNYVNFSGRAHRTEYWMFTLIDTIIIIGLAVAMFATTSSSFDSYGGDPYYFESQLTSSPLYYIYILYGWGLALPRLAVVARRLHDTDRSAWWMLIPLIPFVGWIILFIFLVSAGTDGHNRFGSDPWDEGYEDDEYDEYEEDDYEEEDRRRPPSRAASHPQDRQQTPVRRYRPEDRPQPPPQKDIYDLNESFKEPPASPRDASRRPTRAVQQPDRARQRTGDDGMPGYKNPFDSQHTDQEKKQFDRFGLMDDLDYPEEQPKQAPSSRPRGDGSDRNK